MASPNAVAAMLAMFHELYPTRNVGVETAVAWEWALAKITDERMMWAAQQLVSENSGRTFFPTPNELMAYLSNAVEHAMPHKRLNDGNESVDTAVYDWYRDGGPARMRAENTEKAKHFPLTKGNLFQ